MGEGVSLGRREREMPIVKVFTIVYKHQVYFYHSICMSCGKYSVKSGRKLTPPKVSG